MKNANVFVDVDLTLVDGNGKLLAGARERLLAMKQAGRHWFLRSTVGADYCRKVAESHHLTELFEGSTAKPGIVVDEMPSTCVTSFVFNVQQQSSWPALARRIIERQADK